MPLACCVSPEAFFFLAFLLGTGLGILAGRCRYVELFSGPFMLTIKSVPVASYVILCLIWLSPPSCRYSFPFDGAACPCQIMLQGFKTADPKFEMAGLYGVPFGRRLVFIHLPQISLALRLRGCLRYGPGAGVAAEG